MARNNLGQIRQSQAMSTFGVGSIADFVTGTFMPLGLDYWPPLSPNQRILEPDLEAFLGVSFLRSPPIEDHQPLPATRFPEWLICSNPKCKALGKVREIINNDQGNQPSNKFNNPDIAFESINGVNAKCLRCNVANSMKTGIPARLVIVCCNDPQQSQDHPGHIEDFPWQWWCHGRKYPDLNGGTPHHLTLKEGDGLSFQNIIVKCGCGSEASLQGVFGEKLLGYTCKGKSPWLSSKSNGCTSNVRTMQRGATSLHAPVVLTYISIPPFTEELGNILAMYREDFHSKWRDNAHMRADNNLVPLNDDGKIAWINKKYDESIRPKLAALVHDKNQAINILKKFIEDPHQEQGPVEGNSSSRKSTEYIELSRENGNARTDFQTKFSHNTHNIFPHGSMQDVIKVHRLKEVSAMLGFRRETGGAPLDLFKITKQLIAPIFLSGGNAARQNNPAKPNWLPAIELRGEGLFFRLNIERLNKFLKYKLESNNNRLSNLFDRINKNNPNSPQEKRALAKTTVIHTLSHLLIRQLTVSCGYSSASLKERLYVDTDDCGFLIYTSTPGADGTRGGLVRMGERARLQPIVESALENARWCSADPICCTSLGQGADGMNLAACHGCALVPETSCELHNKILDRAMLVCPRGMQSELGLGYFDDF